jgi:hypothetical protein
MRLRGATLGALLLAGALTPTTAVTASAAPPSVAGGSGPYSAGYETSLRSRTSADGSPGAAVPRAGGTR